MRSIVARMPPCEKGCGPLLPATPAARLRAALVDVSIAGLLGLLTRAGVWLSGYPEHAWIGLALAGLLLVGRDVFGPGSPGKALLGLRVVSADLLQSTPSATKRLLRNVLLLVAPVGLMIETLVLIHHPLAQRLGDGWASTQVVDDPLAGDRARGRREVFAQGAEGTP